MPLTLSNPGVYIQEIPSPVHTIAAVPTAVAAFVGRARRGLVNTPIRISSPADFERAFGPVWNQSELGYAVQQYYLNGGADAYVVRAITQLTLSNFNASPPPTLRCQRVRANFYAFSQTAQARGSPTLIRAR